MKIMLSILFILILMPFKVGAQSDYVNTDVDIITISPGEFYWSAFGHTAIRIKSGQSDLMYGFGYFDFAEEDFFFKFAKGEMKYFLGVVDSKYELENYQLDGRKITSQRLSLSNNQKRKLLDQLVFLSLPENRYYSYDYFLNNCTSRIRDILDEITFGEISKPLKQQATATSWNDLTFPAVNQTWMNLGIAYIYGLPAFQKKNQWQLSVFPEVFSQDLKSIKTKNNWNKDLKVLNSPSQEESLFTQYSFLQTHYAVIFCVLILMLGLLVKSLSKPTIIFWLIIQSLLGVGLFLLWFFTKHNIAMWNINIMIFFPLAWILLLEKVRKPWVLKGFLLMNIFWVVLALFFTSLYLSGFSLVNILLYKQLKTTKIA